MPEITKVVMCWGCGHEQSACICEGGFTPNIVTPPKTVLPFCGGQTINMDAPWNDPKLYDVVMPRPCCNCGEDWEATHHAHEHGVCPHCGAHGADGIGGKS